MNHSSLAETHRSVTSRRGGRGKGKEEEEGEEEYGATREREGSERVGGGVIRNEGGGRGEAGKEGGEGGGEGAKEATEEEVVKGEPSHIEFQHQYPVET